MEESEWTLAMARHPDPSMQLAACRCIAEMKLEDDGIGKETAGRLMRDTRLDGYDRYQAMQVYLDDHDARETLRNMVQLIDDPATLGWLETVAPDDPFLDLPWYEFVRRMSKFGPGEAKGRTLGELVQRALTTRTGQSFGADKAAWLAYVDGLNKDEPRHP